MTFFIRKVKDVAPSSETESRWLILIAGRALDVPVFARSFPLAEVLDEIGADASVGI